MRVLVTRPLPDTQRWVDALQACGVQSQAMPLIAIQPTTAQAALQEARNEVDAYDIVMFVSANAVRHFFDTNASALQHAPISWGRGSMKRVRAWCAGEGTRQALLLAGVPQSAIDAPASVAGQTVDSETLWQVVRSQVQTGTKVLVVRGMNADTTTSENAEADPAQGVGREWLAQQIRAHGGDVRFVVAYQRLLPNFTAAENLLVTQTAVAHAEMQSQFVWLFSSAQAVHHLVQAFPYVQWRCANAIATHPRIVQTAKDAGFGWVALSHPSPCAVANVLQQRALSQHKPDQ